MTDPNGALPFQRKGDVAVFDGHQWQSSNRGVPVQQSGSSPSSGYVNFVEGTSTVPAPGEGVTGFFSRYSNFSGANDINAAVWGIHQNAGTGQPVGVMGQAISAGNAVGVYGLGKSTGSAHGAFGGFFFATNNHAGGDCVGVGNNVQNLTGDNCVFTDGRMVGFDSVYDANATGKTGSVAYLARSADPGTDKWDSGFVASGDAFASHAFFEDSHATTGFKMSGTHTNALDMSAATISGKYVMMDSNYWMGFNSGNAILVMDANDFLAYIRSTNDYQFFIGNTVVADIAGGTPGAGNTNLSLMQGAGPTLSQIKYFADGSGHNVLYF